MCSRIDLWFARDTLWRLTAKDVKEEAHRITSALVEEAEGETPGTASVPPGGEAGREARGARTAEGDTDVKAVVAKGSTGERFEFCGDR